MSKPEPFGAGGPDRFPAGWSQTTRLNVLASAILDHERIVTIEDSTER